MAVRVFIVEDHPAMQQAYALLIENEPDLMLCGVAASGEEAQEALRHGACDLALVDVSLPGMSGFDLIAWLRAEHPGLRVIVISGHHDAGYARRALEAGASAYVNKLDLLSRLPDAIRQAFGEAASGGHA